MLSIRTETSSRRCNWLEKWWYHTEARLAKQTNAYRSLVVQLYIELWRNPSCNVHSLLILMQRARNARLIWFREMALEWVEQYGDPVNGSADSIAMAWHTNGWFQSPRVLMELCKKHAHKRPHLEVTFSMVGSRLPFSTAILWLGEPDMLLVTPSNGTIVGAIVLQFRPDETNEPYVELSASESGRIVSSTSTTPWKPMTRGERAPLDPVNLLRIDGIAIVVRVRLAQKDTDD